MPDDELFALAAKKQLTANLDAQVRAHAQGPEGRGPGRELRHAVAPARPPQDVTPRPEALPDVQRAAARGHAQGDGAVLRRHHPRGPQHPRPDRRRLHLPQRPPGQPLRHRRHRRQLRRARSRRGPAASRSAARSSSASTCRRRRARRPADPGQRADRDLEPDAHLAGQARPLGARTDARHAAAAAAAGRARAGRGRQGAR